MSKSACKLILSVLRFASAKVECDNATAKFIFIAFFIAWQKHPANPDKYREEKKFKKNSAMDIYVFHRTFYRILTCFTHYLQ